MIAAAQRGLTGSPHLIYFVDDFQRHFRFREFE